MEKVLVYADGACHPNPGVGGLGIVIIYEDGRRDECSQGFYNSTNNRMELLGVIKALQLLKLKENIKIEVFSDSKYVVDSINKKWLDRWEKNNWKFKLNGKKEVKNKDLWKFLFKLKDKHPTTFTWVKGHAENINNNRCDILASKAIKSNKLYEDIGYII